MVALPAIPDFPLFRPGSGPGPAGWFLAGVALLVLVSGWLILGRGPRRRRAYRRVLRFLHEKAWQQALTAIGEMRGLIPPFGPWQDRVRRAEGQGHQLAGDHFLGEQAYEKALEHYQAAARFLNLDEVEAHRRVVENMLVEVRHLYASGTSTSLETLPPLIARTLLIDSSCAEAYFWQGLAQVREGKEELALASWRQARDLAGQVLDPALYLGVLLLRQGQTPEGLRYLSEAHRLAPDSPFVGWQLGTALVAGGRDRLALRPLQRALGPAGFPRWAKDPARAWVEG
ncbi:MAG: tetratricopeptide repeat protein, partial [Planctomycetes bacterium]|nr:tetratricopeptide repeat protein [Planctomycetota bacterium]